MYRIYPYPKPIDTMNSWCLSVLLGTLRSSEQGLTGLTCKPPVCSALHAKSPYCVVLYIMQTALIIQCPVSLVLPPSLSPPLSRAPSTDNDQTTEGKVGGHQYRGARKGVHPTPRAATRHCTGTPQRCHFSQGYHDTHPNTLGLAPL